MDRISEIRELLLKDETNQIRIPKADVVLLVEELLEQIDNQRQAEEIKRYQETLEQLVIMVDNYAGYEEMRLFAQDALTKTEVKGCEFVENIKKRKGE